MKLSVSVVIPCYNAEKYIAEAIASALAQTRTPDEIIVVDDGSTDSSVEVIRRFPVKLLRTGRNSGHATARNIGIRAARGEAIAWLDADDRWDPIHLETVVGLLDANPGAAVAFSGVRFIGSREGCWVCRQSPGVVRDAFLECLRRTIVPAMSAVTRSDPVRSAGGFDESIRISPDYEFWLRLSRHHGFVSIPETTAEYRWHPEQISRDPMRQLRSVQESRAGFISRVARSESEAAAAGLRRVSHVFLDEDLTQAWIERDRQAVAFYLDARKYLGGTTPTHRRIRLLSGLPDFAIALWDRVPGNVRQLIRSMLIRRSQPIHVDAEARVVPRE